MTHTAVVCAGGSQPRPTHSTGARKSLHYAAGSLSSAELRELVEGGKNDLLVLVRPRGPVCRVL
jgi:hypothetical protein